MVIVDVCAEALPLHAPSQASAASSSARCHLRPGAAPLFSDLLDTAWLSLLSTLSPTFQHSPCQGAIWRVPEREGGDCRLGSDNLAPALPDFRQSDKRR